MKTFCHKPPKVARVWHLILYTIINSTKAEVLFENANFVYAVMDFRLSIG